MSKMDITIGKTITINTGNYQSVRPTVSITLKDVDISESEKTYRSLSILVDQIFNIEALNCSDVLQTLREEGGYTGYCKSVIDQLDDIEKTIEKELNVINNTK